jgi:hypothetical protein
MHGVLAQKLHCREGISAGIVGIWEVNGSQLTVHSFKNCNPISRGAGVLNNATCKLFHC